MAAKIQIRRGTAAAWAASNPVLADGQQGFERDTNRLKIGDGVTPWNLLLYQGTVADPNYKGYFATEAALIAAYAVGQVGWYAIVGATDTVWVWDGDGTAWVDSGSAPVTNNLAADIHGATEKTTLQDDDEFAIADAYYGAFSLKKVKKSTLQKSILEVQGYAVSDEDTAIETGTAKVTFRMPYAFTLTGLRASMKTAPTGLAAVFDLNEEGISVLSTKLSIDAGEKTSITAATPVVISDAALANDAEMTFDFDQKGATIAGTGVKFYLYGYKA